MKKNELRLLLVEMGFKGLRIESAFGDEGKARIYSTEQGLKDIIIAMALNYKTFMGSLIVELN